MSTSTLSRKLKSLSKQIPEFHVIRLHRAISWLKASENHEKDSEIKFMCLWIGVNSLYGIDDAHYNNLQERERFADFVEGLILLDQESRLYNVLWNNFSGPIRILINNHFVYEPFWDHIRGINREWQRNFNKSVEDANTALAAKNVKYLLQLVLDRLYVLRNQLIHGGATFKSKVNRSQIKDGNCILMNLLPIFIDIMLENPNEDWGNIYYPPVI